MKHPTFWSHFLCLFSLVSGKPKSNGFISFDLFHSSDLKSSGRLTSREIDAVLNNQYSWYGIESAIGTPPQMVTLQVDTGSSDMWVGGNQFSASSSSTYHENTTDPFEIKYGDGSGATGTYAQDKVTIMDLNVTSENANFGYAPSSQAFPQVVGIGMAENEATTGPRYSNLPMQLKEQGFISAMVYSMRSGSYTSPGQLVFGGIDHSQYEGELQSMPLVSSSTFTVQLDGIFLKNQTVYSTPQPALLDSGTTNLISPNDMILASINGMEPEQNWQPGNGFAVNCTSVKPDSYFELSFSGARMRLPFKNIVDPPSLTREGEVPTSGTCGLGIQVGSDVTPVILGDRFSVGVYAVYDIDNRQVALANVRENNGTYSNLTSQPDSEPVQNNGVIPGAVKAPNYSSVAVSAMAGRVEATAVVSSASVISPNSQETSPPTTASTASSTVKTSSNSAQIVACSSLLSLASIILFFL